MTGYRNGYINFDSPRNVFYPGQVISGSVVIELEQPLTLSMLYVNFYGEGKVIWSELESEEYNGVKRYKRVEYVGREEYFNVTQLLAGGSAPLSLPPGTHTYKFSYQIPPGVPSSFNGERGNITYNTKANLELRGQTELKEELTKAFDVVAPFDLNLGSPRLKEPIDLEFEEVYNCGCFFGSDPITIKIRLPVSGYCPGQVIPVALEVENGSSVEIRKMIFQICRREKYRTQRPISEYVPPEVVLNTVKQGAIMSGTKRNLTVKVPVPELIAPNLENCGIIDVGYFFKAIIKLSGCNDDLEDEAEICLGLIPLNETLEGEYVHPLAQSLPLGPIPEIPATNHEEENRQFSAHQQSAYPNGPFPNAQAGYPNAQAGYPNAQAGYPNGPPVEETENVFSSYFVKVQQQQFSSTDPSQNFVQVQQQRYSSTDPSQNFVKVQQYSSTDPSKNFNIGFTMTSPPGSQSWGSSPYPNTDLRIHLPQPNVNINTPSAPPPSS